LGSRDLSNERPELSISLDYAAPLKHNNNSPNPSGEEKKKMTTEEKIDRLTGIVDALAATVVAHDNQIEGLINIGEQHDRRLREVAEMVAKTERQWQAYINTLPKN
jgi:nucleoside-diphosphate-sugar epimerase